MTNLTSARTGRIYSTVPPIQQFKIYKCNPLFARSGLARILSEFSGRRRNLAWYGRRMAKQDTHVGSEHFVAGWRGRGLALQVQSCGWERTFGSTTIRPKYFRHRQPRIHFDGIWILELWQFRLRDHPRIGIFRRYNWQRNINWARASSLQRIFNNSPWRIRHHHFVRSFLKRKRGPKSKLGRIIQSQFNIQKQRNRIREADCGCHKYL